MQQANKSNIINRFSEFSLRSFFLILPLSFLELLRTCPGNFPEMLWTCPGPVPEISRQWHRYFLCCCRALGLLRNRKTAGNTNRKNNRKTIGKQVEKQIGKTIGNSMTSNRKKQEEQPNNGTKTVRTETINSMIKQRHSACSRWGPGAVHILR
jgi:hypothetical protein